MEDFKRIIQRNFGKEIKKGEDILRYAFEEEDDDVIDAFYSLDPIFTSRVAFQMGKINMVEDVIDEDVEFDIQMIEGKSQEEIFAIFDRQMDISSQNFLLTMFDHQDILIDYFENIDNLEFLILEAIRARRVDVLENIFNTRNLDTRRAHIYVKLAISLNFGDIVGLLIVKFPHLYTHKIIGEIIVFLENYDFNLINPNFITLKGAVFIKNLNNIKSVKSVKKMTSKDLVAFRNSPFLIFKYLLTMPNVKQNRYLNEIFEYLVIVNNLVKIEIMCRCPKFKAFVFEGSENANKIIKKYTSKRIQNIKKKTDEILESTQILYHQLSKIRAINKRSKDNLTKDTLAFIFERDSIILRENLEFLYDVRNDVDLPEWFESAYRNFFL